MFTYLQNKHTLAKFFILHIDRYIKLLKKTECFKIIISAACLPEYILKYYMKKFFKVGLIIFILSALVAMPIKAAKYDKKKPSDLYTKALEHLDKNQYGKAQKVLRIYTRKKKDDADGWTLLAFSSRKLGSYANAEKYYEKALELDPENKAALEYQGELFVVLDRLQMANENLNKLKSLCPDKCDELIKLEDFISNKKEKEKTNI